MERLFSVSALYIGVLLFVACPVVVAFAPSASLAMAPSRHFDVAPLQGMTAAAALMMTTMDNDKDGLNGSSSSSSSSSSRTTNLPVRIAQQVQPSVVLVIPKGVRNMTVRGSGFVLEADEMTATLDWEPNLSESNHNRDGNLYVITAAHVAVPGYSLQVTVPTFNHFNMTDDTKESLSYPATVVARNTTLDLALLRVNTTATDSKKVTFPPGLTLAVDAPPVGTFAFAHGHPASRLQGPAMTLGIVCGIANGLGLPDNEQQQQQRRRSREEESNSTTTTTSSSSSSSPFANDSTTFVVTDAAMSGGMSGGPLVDDTGAVIGVNALIRPDLRALGNYAVSSLEVNHFLRSIPHPNKGAGGAESSSIEYKVWLYNDAMNKRARVAAVLHKVADLNAEMANEVMMAAHTTGRGLVGRFTTEADAKTIYESLRHQDLLVEMET